MQANHKNTSFDIYVQHGGGDSSFICSDNQSLLAAMEKAGLAVVPVGCRGGGCGVCKIAIEQGEFKTGKMSKRHVSDEELAAGNVSLACRTYPESTLIIKPLGKLFGKFQPTKVHVNMELATTKEG